MGAVGATASTIFSQWVQWVQLHPQYSASGCRQCILHPQYSRKKHLFIMHKYRSRSMTSFAVLGSISQETKHAKSIRYRFYRSFTLSWKFWNPLPRMPSAASDLRLCTLHPQCSRRSYANEPRNDIHKKQWLFSRGERYQ